MTAYLRCPQCASLQVSSDIGGGAEVDLDHRPPIAQKWVLLISVPLGLFCAYMLVQFGPGSGLGLWVLGLVLAIATPIYSWKQHQLFENSTRGWSHRCTACGFEWEAPLEGV